MLLAVAVAFGLGRRPGASGTRRAAVLGAATGISWGFMAAVIKELSSHLDDGVGAIFSSWSLYLLIVAGAATMLLASHALAAGPLAASQPGFTILDPLAASLLGMFLFGEHIRTGAADLAGEALALAAVIAAAAVLSHSCHLADQSSQPSCLVKAAASSAACAEGAGGVPVRRPAQRPRRDGTGNPAPAPARQHVPRSDEVSAIALRRGSIGDNHVAEFEEDCRVAEMPAEPGRGRPGAGRRLTSLGPAGTGAGGTLASEGAPSACLRAA